MLLIYAIEFEQGAWRRSSMRKSPSFDSNVYAYFGAHGSLNRYSWHKSDRFDQPKMRILFFFEGRAAELRRKIETCNVGATSSF